jgi:F420-0:gamma-glutamyl ligase
MACEGTTPRKVRNLVASLADLVSGSADANTPVVIVRGFI